MSRGRAAVLRHERASVGSVGEWAAAREIEVLDLEASGDWAIPSFEEIDFVISMGSASASYDDGVPWLARELEMLRAAVAAEVPVLGICFGSQALARTLGASTHLATEHEIGWVEVETFAPELIAPGPWLFWHEDSFAVPDGAELLARTPVGPAAFRAGRNLAVQFHPEATPAALTEWLEMFKDHLKPEEADRLRDGMALDPDAAIARAMRLYDLFLDNAELLKNYRASH
jgi:GMP synthase (glutamine-hydrolysing)